MHKPTFTYSFSLALSLALSFSAQYAQATKLNAPPLPRERDAKEFNDDQGETIIPATGTRWNRRHNYREDDKAKKDAEDAAQKAAVDNVKKAQDAQVNAYKSQVQISVDANNAAVALGKQGRWQEAIAEHEKAVQYDSRNKQFRINLSAARTAFAQQCMAKNNLTSAAALFRKALAAAPDNALAGRSLVDCLKKMGYDASSPDTRLKLGDQLAAAGDIEGAYIEYTAAMQLEPSARTYIKMGDTSYRYGQIAQAINWYRQAIVKDPDFGAAHRQLGFLEMAQRDYTSAAASLRKAVILDSKDIAAGTALVDIWRKQVAANPLLAENHLGLAGSMQLTGDFNGADSEYRKLEALDPKNPGLDAGRASLTRAFQHNRAEKSKAAAETLFNQGLKQEALAEISQAVMLEPKNGSYQFLLGECLEAVGDYNGAHQAYLTCVLIDNNQEAAARMRQMQQRGGGLNMAQAAAQIANRLAGQYAQSAAPQAVAAPISPMQMQQMSAPQAVAAPVSPMQMQQMSAPQAVAQQRVAASAAQTAPIAAAPMAAAPISVNDGLSKVTDAEAQKDYTTAIAVLREISASNLQNPEIHHRLAINLLASGQISEAVSEFRIASALCPSKKEYSDNLARALAIHKRSLMTDANTQGHSADGVTGATK